eukprot:GHVQ01035981.1.p1 GENE.GHVQ01035981.1~~GHVQ01035981.1.p1  ORF type:complete len:564 (+),score=51.59 GHVQ01035981.1:68-1759(+)
MHSFYRKGSIVQKYCPPRRHRICKDGLMHRTSIAVESVEVFRRNKFRRLCSYHTESSGIVTVRKTEEISRSSYASSPHVMNVLASKVYDVVSETPLDTAPRLSEITGNIVHLKREDLHPVFSFKLRGAYNKIAHLTAVEKQAGVVACSAGNHAQGVAYASKMLGLQAKIFMPTMTPAIKVDNVRRLGAEVVLSGIMFDETTVAAMECARAEGKTLIHPFDDQLVIAGQGTIALELIKQLDPAKIHAVFVCCGGGGMLAGIGAFLKSVAPDIKIVGVEAADAPTMTRSLLSGRIVPLESVGTFADGAAVRTAGAHTFDICKDVVDEMVLCTTDEICGAIKDGFSDIRVVLEPAGALAIGANMDFDRLRFVSERADTSERLLSVVIPEKPGTFKAMYKLIFPRQVTEFAYRLRSDEGGKAYILLSFQPLRNEPPDTVHELLQEAGYGVMNLQFNEMAKVHGRYMAGGAADVKDELLYRFEFPEKPGALQRFLHSLSDFWNVSLFHYRNHGADVGRVLVGIQVPEDSRTDFIDFLQRMEQMGYTYNEETSNDMYRQFLMTTSCCDT